MLNGKNVILGISGGIAAFKAPSLVRLLTAKGANVKVVCTKNALQFVTPLTLETLSNNKIYCDVFDNVSERKTEHISISDWADIMVVAPATANIVAKFVCGIADDALSTTFLAFDKQVFIAPAMNTKMWNSAAVVENIEKLRSRNISIIGPEKGDLACGTKGEGRMSDPEVILSYVENELGKSQSLSGKNVLISAGPTVEKLDPVRFLSNFSSGKMGYAVAKECKNRGANVFLVSGPVSLPEIPGVNHFHVQSADQMHQKCLELFGEIDIAVMAAAVADYKPAVCENKKIKKEDSDGLTLSMVKNPDILLDLGKRKSPKQILIGFALETDNGVENARKKLLGKNADFIVLNSMSNDNPCFNSDVDEICIVSSSKEKVFPVASKRDVARNIVDEIECNLK